MADSTDSSANVSGITADLHNINLDVKSPTVTFIYENDQKSKTMSDSTPDISKYFTQNNTQPKTTETVSFFNEIQTNSQEKKSSKAEPVVCRIFAEAPPQQKPADPTTNFFDLIGNKTTMNSSGLVSELGLGTKDISDVSFTFSTCYFL